MSTNASITAQMRDGTFSNIYCHFDGYLEHVGRLLLTHYNDQDKVEALMALGDISVLGASTECPEGHSYNSRIEGYCLAYGRDRGEEGTSAARGLSAPEARHNGTGLMPWNYVWQDGAWTCQGMSHKAPVPLSDVVDPLPAPSKPDDDPEATAKIDSFLENGVPLMGAICE